MNIQGENVQPKMSVLAILAFVFAFVCGPIGLILGVIAAISVGRSGGKLKGMGFAIAAMPISIAFAGILAATSIPSFINYTRRAKTSEARVNLDRCIDSVRFYYEQNNALPASSAWTPASPPGSQKYLANPAAWMVSPWSEIGFSVDDPHFYQYQLASEGGEVFCRARGDLDGDGVYSFFERGISVNNGPLQVSPGYFEENPLE